MRIILLLFIALLIIYIFKSNIIRLGKIIEGNGGIDDVSGVKQPTVDKEIYNYSLEQAVAIWREVIGESTEGSHYPTMNNQILWKHEDWKKELNTYRQEADKFHKEHNWYDYVEGKGDIITVKRFKGKKEKIYPLGIREASKRIRKDRGEYKFPKIGDRVRLLKDEENENSDYFTGIVLDGDVSKATNTLVLWDKRKSEEGQKDRKRYKTKELRAEVDISRVELSGKEFGWPKYPWKRHWRDNKQTDHTGPTSWLRTKDKTNNGQGFYDAKILYKVVVCLKDDTTGCDFLKCGERKKAVLRDYPITYHCGKDLKNKHENDKVWKCQGGSRDGSFYNYYDKTTMCREDYKPGVNDSFCKQSCSGGTCVKKKLTDEINNVKNSGNKCAFLVSDDPNNIEDGNFMLLRNDIGYKENNSYDINRKYYHDVYWKTKGKEGKWIKATKNNPMKIKGQEKYMGWKKYKPWPGWFSISLPKFWKKRTIYKTENRYGARGRYKYRQLKVNGSTAPFGGTGKGHCTHKWYYPTRLYKSDPIRWPKVCQEKTKGKITISNWVPSRLTSINSKILKNGKIRSMKIYGSGCKFITNNKSYNTIGKTIKNLNLSGGNYGCAMPKKVGLYECGNNIYQNFNRCESECKGTCKPKMITLSRNPCSYKKGDKINNKTFIPL